MRRLWLGTESSSCCNYFGWFGLKVPSIRSNCRAGLFGTQPGRKKYHALKREDGCSEIRLSAHACKVALPRHAKQATSNFLIDCTQDTSLSTSTEVQAEVDCGFTTIRARTAKFCFPQMPQQPHFTISLQVVCDCDPT